MPLAGSHRTCPSDWVVDGQFTPAGVDAVAALLGSQSAGADDGSPVSLLTRAERAVASSSPRG